MALLVSTLENSKQGTRRHTLANLPAQCAWSRAQCAWSRACPRWDSACQPPCCEQKTVFFLEQTIFAIACQKLRSIALEAMTTFTLEADSSGAPLHGRLETGLPEASEKFAALRCPKSRSLLTICSFGANKVFDEAELHVAFALRRSNHLSHSRLWGAGELVCSLIQLTPCSNWR